MGAQAKERKGSNFAAQRSGAIVLQARRAKYIQSKNLPFGNLGRYTEEVFYYTYDFESLVADFGGYMGLLLGHSVLTLYDYMSDLTKSIF